MINFFNKNKKQRDRQTEVTAEELDVRLDLLYDVALKAPSLSEVSKLKVMLPLLSVIGLLRFVLVMVVSFLMIGITTMLSIAFATGKVSNCQRAGCYNHNIIT